MFECTIVKKDVCRLAKTEQRSLQQNFEIALDGLTFKFLAKDFLVESGVLLSQGVFVLGVPRALAEDDEAMANQVFSGDLFVLLALLGRPVEHFRGGLC